MKKALSILLALVMVIGVFPTFADTKAEDKKAEKPAVEVSASEKALEALKGYGAIKGDGTADPFKMESELKRQNAAVILVRLLGVENDAKATEVKEKPFTDLPNDEFYKSIIQYVKAKGIFKGTSSEKFGFNEAITAQQFATINLRALGYEVDTDEAYGKALETAKKLGLLKDASALENNTKILRKDVYVIMNNTLETPKKDGKKALKYELGYATEPVVEKLEVVDAMANGLKVLKVEFNMPVDEYSLDKIEITDKDENDVKKTAVLSEDKKTAMLVLVKEAEQNSTLNVVVENVRTEDRKQKVEKFEKKVLFVDTDRPVVSSVEALNPKEIVVAVSEPINLESKSYKKIKEIKIDDKEVYARVENDYDGKLVLTLYKGLKEGEHKVVIEGLKDFADLPSAAFEQDITVVDDKEAPAAAEAKMLTLEKVKVTFNENLDKLGDFKVNGKKVSKVERYKKSKKEVVLDLKEKLDMGAIVEVKVEYKGQRDIMGNEVKNWEKLTFSVADDTDLPTAEFKEFDKDDAHKVLIQFSKPMQKKGEWKLKNKDGKIVQSGDVSKGDNVKYLDETKPTEDNSVLVFELKELKDKDPKDYTLVLEKFKDATVRQNEMPKTEIEFKGKDTKAPKVVDEAYSLERKKIADNEYEFIFTFAFTEKMDQDTLKAKSNYTVDSDRLDQITDSKIKVLEDGRKVQLILKGKTDTAYGTTYNGENEATASAHKIKVVGLKDENKQTLAPVELSFQAPGTIELKAKVEVVRLNDNNDQALKFKFNKDVRILDASKFTLAGDGILSFEGDIDNYKDEFTFNVEKFTFKDDLSNEVAFTIAKEAVQDSRGIKNDVISYVNGHSEKDYEDALAPRIALNDKEEKLITVASNNPRQISITFTEELDNDVKKAVVSLAVTKDGKIVKTTDESLADVSAQEPKRILNFNVPKMENGDEFKIQISVRDKAGVVSKVMSEDLTVSGLEVALADELKGVKIEAGDAAGQIKLTPPAQASTAGGKFKLQFGAHYPNKDDVLATVGGSVEEFAAATNKDAGANTHVTVYETKADDKVISFVVLSLDGYVTLTAPEHVKIVAGSANPIDITTADIAAGATTVAFDSASNKTTFKIEVKKAAGMGALQDVEVSVTGDAIIEQAFSATLENDDLTVTTEDIVLKGEGQGKIVVKITQAGKAPKVYESDLTVN